MQSEWGREGGRENACGALRRVLDVFPCLKLLSDMLKRLHDQFEQAAGRGVTVFRIS